MHVLLGCLIVAGSFVLSLRYMAAEFSGFLSISSAILLVGVPLGLVVTSGGRPVPFVHHKSISMSP